MKRCGKTLLCLAGVLAMSPVVWAAVNDSPDAAVAKLQVEGESDQPYSSIWVRNVFDLKPPAPPPTNAPPPTPPVNVHLLGITALFNTKRAILSVQSPAGKAPGKDESYSMTEGERRGQLEVLEIDPQNRKVKIKNDDLVSTITFETNKPSAGGAPAQAMNGASPSPGQPGGFFTPPPTPGGATPLPARTLRPSPGFSQNNNGTQPNYQPSGFQSGGYQPTAYQSTGYQTGSQPTYAANYSAGTTAAGLNLGNAFSQPQSAINNAPEPEVPLEQTAVQLAVQTAVLQRQGIPVPPPPPPLAIPDDIGANDNNANTTTTPTQTRNPHARITGNFPLPPGVPGIPGQ